MPLIDLQSPPTESMQRWFGLSLGAVLAILAFSVVPSGAIRQAILSIGIFVTVVYYVMPSTKLPIIRAWQRITFPIAWTVGHFLFGIVFFALVTPIGLLLRVFGHDPLRLRKTDGTTSFWKDRPARSDANKEDPRQYFRQY
ncbi:hypothetical protein CA13_42870 [Planctomycetes bacterium CA13]|uniref:SxtJ n=1 Tax=Novipirellula herctigrandis TaxID=2527986 RepID=A0A5C5Z6D9_9BACT|nr:hypothetical protein CA13_42870 [Planctomycetes bacterium CA13]